MKWRIPREGIAMTDTTIASFTDHAAAEAAGRRLADAGFALGKPSTLGRGHHTGKQVTGFHTTADRVKFWGGIPGLFAGGMLLTVPAVGSLLVLGAFAVTLHISVENAVIVGGLSALGAALYGTSVPRDSVIAYEAVVKADGSLVMAHGTAEEAARARAILDTSASQVAVHPGVIAPEPALAAMA
jgi:hypothetical protein